MGDAEISCSRRDLLGVALSRDHAPWKRCMVNVEGRMKWQPICGTCSDVMLFPPQIPIQSYSVWKWTDVPVRCLSK